MLNRPTRLLVLALLAGLAVVPPLVAQQIHGSIAAGYAWLDVNGNGSAFRTQETIDQGFLLDDLRLTWGRPGHGPAGSLNAWGFGQAEPSEHARLTTFLGRGWHLDLGYDSRDSFLALASAERAARADRWHITRYRATTSWDGWRFAKLELALSRTERGGVIHQPLYAFHDRYPGQVTLDETRDQAALRIETRTLPVHVTFEQTYAHYERKNRWAAAPPGFIDPDNTGRLTGLGTTFEDDQDVPTSRLTADWAGSRVAVTAGLLYSAADLDATGAGWRELAVDGGAAGTLRFVDDLIGSATTDTLAGELRAAVILGPHWYLRLNGHYRDASTDSTLLGQRLLHAANPTGIALDLSAPVNDNGRFDFTDTRGELDLEHRASTWSAWAGVLGANRDVSWRLTQDGEPVDTSRSSTGFLAGAAFHPGHGIDGNVEYEHGDFNDYIFRTDPDTVDKVTARVRARLGHGWHLAVHGRWEQSSNPAPEADLESTSAAAGLSCSWTPPGSTTTIGADLGVVGLTTDTGLVLPTGTPGHSRYDMSLRTVSLYGSAVLGIIDLNASCRYLTDNGDTWPVDAWNVDLRAGVHIVAHIRLEGFVQYWSYDEDRANRDDFDASRYGVVVGWSF